MNIPFVDGDEVRRRLPFTAAIGVLERALLDGLDPEDDTPRQVLTAGAGELLVMASASGGAVATKLVTVGGDPRIQGVCVVFDPDTLAPRAILDGVALTEIRTAAVSALAVRHLAVDGARRLVVFGRGPQGRAHDQAIRTVRRIEQVEVIGRGDSRDGVRGADVIVCATTATEPLFDGRDVAEHAVVVAIGSHDRAARETDDALAGRATVVVESRRSAAREAGDVIAAVDSGALVSDRILTLAELVAGAELGSGPRLFKSTGMSWEDAVLAAHLAA